MYRNVKHAVLPLVLAAAALSGCGGTSAPKEIECSLQLSAQSTAAEVARAIDLVKAGSIDPCGDGMVREVLAVDAFRDPDSSLRLRFRMRAEPERPLQEP